MTNADRIDLILHHAMKVMPAPLCSALGARLAPLMGRKANPVANAEAAALMAMLRPEWGLDGNALSAAMDRLWACTGRTFAEFAISHRLLKSGRAAVSNGRAFDEAIGQDRPVIAIFLHTGNWELSVMQLAHRAPGRALLLFDPPRTRPIRARIAETVRRQAPMDIQPATKIVWRKALDQLGRKGGILMTAADEAVDGHIGAPFFGRPVQTTGNLGKVARLALKTGALVVPFYNERHDHLTFTTHVLEPLSFTGAGDDGDAVRSAVMAMDAALAPAVYRLLDQWFTLFLYRAAAPGGWLQSPAMDPGR